MRDLKKFTAVLVRQEIEKSGNIKLLEKLRLKSQDRTYSQRKQVFKVWQDRFDDLYLFSKKVLEIKLEYIHTNPLQKHWNLVTRPEFWPDSSAMFYELEKQPAVTITDYRELF